MEKVKHVVRNDRKDTIYQLIFLGDATNKKLFVLKFNLGNRVHRNKLEQFRRRF